MSIESTKSNISGARTRLLHRGVLFEFGPMDVFLDVFLASQESSYFIGQVRGATGGDGLM